MDLSLTDGIGTITLNQPEEYNRMPGAFWSEFPAAVAELDASGRTRALIIASTGRHFSAGMDLSVFTGARGPELERGRAGEAGRRRLDGLQDVFSQLERVRMPVLAAIQGGCVGGGVDLVAACDMRYCTEDAFFCIQEINIGLAADVGTLQRLPRAAEAKEIGLVNQVYASQEEMLEAVRGIAAEIASKSPLAVASSKHLLNYGRDHSIADALQYQQLWMGAVPQGGEMATYFKSKSDGSQPRYEDLAPLDGEGKLVS
jgi:enoyl-CoA hydratase